MRVCYERKNEGGAARVGIDRTRTGTGLLCRAGEMGGEGGGGGGQAWETEPSNERASQDAVRGGELLVGSKRQ